MGSECFWFQTVHACSALVLGSEALSVVWKQRWMSSNNKVLLVGQTHDLITPTEGIFFRI